MPSEPARVSAVWPLIEVSDIQRSASFYIDHLGFQLVADDASEGRAMQWCRVSRGGASLMLQARGEATDGAKRGHGVCLYFVCDDVDLLFEELAARGLDIKPPELAYYGMKQLYVREPDGYEICFESPTEEHPNEP